MLHRQKQTGFTIVELLIVVVVIGILASITIAAFSGIQQRAQSAAMQSDLSQALRKVEVTRGTSASETYPADLTAAGVPASNNGTLSYFYSSPDNSYCAQIVKGSVTYVATSSVKVPTVGSCIDTGLIGWWKLNGDSSDASGNGNTGTDNSISNVVGQDTIANHAYGFSGTPSTVSIASTPELSTTIQSFSFWVYPTSWANPTASVFLSKRTANTDGFFIAYVNSSSSIVFDCGGSGQRWTPSYAPPLNQWTHIVLTCSNANGVALYVNGASNGSRSTVSRSNMANTTVMKMGQNAYDGGLTLTGRMDDVRLYTRELSLAEAQLLYAAGAK